MKLGASSTEFRQAIWKYAQERGFVPRSVEMAAVPLCVLHEVNEAFPLDKYFDFTGGTAFHSGYGIVARLSHDIDLNARVPARSIGTDIIDWLGAAFREAGMYCEERPHSSIHDP